MQKHFLLVTIFIFTFIGLSNAQDFVRKQEFQLSLDIMEGIKNANAYYKVGLKNKGDKFWRSRLGRFADFYSNDNKNLFLDHKQFSFGMGYEARLPLIRKSMLVLGIEPFGSFEKYSDYSYKVKPVKAGSSLWATGIGFPIGIILNGSSEWYIGMETIPTMFFQRINKDEFQLYNGGSDSYNFGFYNFALCFGYRIPTKRI